MSFATPLALAWAALTVPVVIFYILKIRLRQVPVSTTIFWQQIYDEKSPRSLWQQLRHWLSLLVQLVWLLLLVLALAEPFFRSDGWQPRRVVLVIDNSASMNATDVSPTRLAAAKAAAAKQVASLRHQDEFAILAAGTQPRVVCGLTSHERTLQDAIDSIGKTDGPTKVPEAVELARRLLADAKNGLVVVYSDGGFAGSEALAADPVVKLHPVGTASGNVGITQFQVRRSLLDPIGYEILVEVVNASDEPAEARLDLDLNDQPVDVVPLKLAPGQAWSQTFEKTSIDGGKLVAKLKHDDPLAADNMAQALLPRREMQKVLLVTPGNLFLEKAFAANPLVDLKVVKELPTEFEKGVVHVFHRLVPPKMPAGNSFVVDPREGTDLWKLGEQLDNPIVTKQETDSPLMQHVRLENVLLPQARQLTPAEGVGAKVLVGAVSGDPLYFQVEAPGRKTAVLTVNLDEGDLTFRTAFPILVTNSLGWFGGQAGELREALVSGAVTDVAIPPHDASKPLALWSPAGVQKPLPAGAEKASVGPLDEIGVWSLRPAETEGTKKASTTKSAGESPGATADAANAPALELACNLASRVEGDLRPPPAWRDLSAAAIGGGTFVRPIWFYLIALAWLLAAVEWVLYQRRWIG